MKIRIKSIFAVGLTEKLRSLFTSTRLRRMFAVIRQSSSYPRETLMVLLKRAEAFFSKIRNISYHSSVQYK
jgi:hypothetical protein